MRCQVAGIHVLLRGVLTVALRRIHAMKHELCNTLTQLKYNKSEFIYFGATNLSFVTKSMLLITRAIPKCHPKSG